VPHQTRRAVVHIGAPKSGTTFLQHALWDLRDALADRGVRAVGAQQREMFLAAVEVREAYGFWGYPEERLEGTWERLAADAQRWHGTSVLSHELLGAATRDQARRALAALEGLEVHVVLTARDLARQVTSEWQERVKNGSTKSFAQFERRLLRQLRAGDLEKGFWLNQDPVLALDRWAEELPPDRVHVVTAPAAGAAPTLLWERFAAAVGFDPDGLDPLAAGRSSNATLGVAQVAVLRRVNQALDGRIPQPQYARVVKSQFAEGVLAAQRSRRPQCPAPLVEELREVAAQHNQVLRERGYVVHGDLEELLPAVPEHDVVPPDQVDRRAERAAYARAVAALLGQRAEARRAAPVPDAVARAAVPAVGSAAHRVGRLRSRVQAWARR